MKPEYFVLYKKDFYSQDWKANTKKRELYDEMKGFGTSERAAEFALDRMQGQPILAKRSFDPANLEEARDPSKPYVVAAYLNNKYLCYSIDDDGDPVPKYEIARCSQSELEGTVREFAEEKPKSIAWGIEMKLFP